MPEQWRHFLSGDLGAAIATLSGAALRGMLGPGPWIWREFGLASLTGLAFTLWVGPALTEALDLGEQVYGGMCLGFGMTALPFTRGVISLFRAWARRPEDFIGRGHHRDDTDGRD